METDAHVGLQTDEAGPGNLQDLPDGPPICPLHEASPVGNCDGRTEGREHPPVDKLPDGAAGAELSEEDAGSKLPVENGPRGPFAGKLPGGAKLPKQAVAGELPQDALADRLHALALTPHDELAAAQEREPSRADKPPEAGPEESSTGDLHGQSPQDEAPGGMARAEGLPMKSGPSRPLPDKLSEVQRMENAAKVPGALLPGKSGSLPDPGPRGAPEPHNACGGVTVSPEALHADSTTAVNSPQTSATACSADITPGHAYVETDPSGAPTSMPTAGNHIISNAERHELADAGAAHSLPQGTPANGPSPSPPLDAKERAQDSALGDLPPAPRLNNMPGGPAMVALPVSGGLEQFGAVAG
jgi:hypothetical protein